MPQPAPLCPCTGSEYLSPGIPAMQAGDIDVKVRTVKERPEGRGGEAPDNKEQKMQDWEEEKEAPDEEGQEV